MALRQFLINHIPDTVKNKIRELRSVRELNSVEKFECATDNLRSENTISISEVFNSKKVNDFWAISRKEIEFFDIPDGTGGVNPGDRRALYYLLCALHPKSVLEIGTHIGASTLHIASALYIDQAKQGEEVRFTTLDIRDVNSETEKPWLAFGTKHSPIEMTNKFNYGSFVNFVTGRSLGFLEKTGQKFDFIFLDGDHGSKTVYQEIPAALKILNRDGVILLHDYFPETKPLWSSGSVLHGPFLATQRLINEGASLTVLPLGNLPWPTKNNSNVTSLALLVRKSPADHSGRSNVPEYTDAQR